MKWSLKLLKKGVEVRMEIQEHGAFDKLKMANASYPMLALYDLALEVQVIFDASDMGMAGILLQKHSVGWKLFHIRVEFERYSKTVTWEKF